MKGKKFFSKVVTVPVKDNRRCGDRTSCGKSDKGCSKD